MRQTRIISAAILLMGVFIYFAADPRPAASSPLLMSEDSYRLPYPPGISPLIRLTQGNFEPGPGSHKGREAFAFDFAQEGNTTFTVVAARSGRILDIREDQPTGCNKPNCANYVVIAHEPDDGTADLYLHLEMDSVIPQVGEWVHRGCPIATADDTGKSTENHLHFVRVEKPDKLGWPHVSEKSVPIIDSPTNGGFEDVEGGVPQYTDPPTSYESNNNSILPCGGVVFSESGVGLSSGPSQLYSVNPVPSGADSLVGTIRTSAGAEPVITDIATSPAGLLYGASFGSLYEIDAASAEATQFGSGFGISGVNALAFDTSGNLFGATVSGKFLSIDSSTGSASEIGSYGSGFGSSGDLDFSPNGTLFATVNSPGLSNDLLVTVDVNDGSATRVSNETDLGRDNVFALVFVGDQLIGLTATAPPCVGGVLLEIDISDGTSRMLRCLSFNSFGGS